MREYTQIDLAWFTKIIRRHDMELKKQENDRWVVGDRLVEMFGPSNGPAKNSLGNDPGHVGMHHFYEDLCRFFGAEMLYPFQWFMDCRRIAGNFPEDQRYKNLPWSKHLYAGSAEIMQQIIEKAEKTGQKLTHEFIRDTRITLLGRERRPYGPRPSVTTPEQIQKSVILAPLTITLPKILADFKNANASITEGFHLFEENKNHYDNQTRMIIIKEIKTVLSVLQEGLKKAVMEPEVSAKPKVSV